MDIHQLCLVVELWLLTVHSGLTVSAESIPRDGLIAAQASQAEDDPCIKKDSIMTEVEAVSQARLSQALRLISGFDC